MLDGYPNFQDIYFGYQLGYQNWHLMDIIGSDIQADIHDVGYHLLWYSTPWYLELMLNMKNAGIWFKYQISVRISGLLNNN
jgi:hypothetical protein